jgi:hypothetical protein
VALAEPSRCQRRPPAHQSQGGGLWLIDSSRPIKAALNECFHALTHQSLHASTPEWLHASTVYWLKQPLNRMPSPEAGTNMLPREWKLKDQAAAKHTQTRTAPRSKKLFLQAKRGDAGKAIRQKQIFFQTICN